ncbi:Cobalamin biosynthesis protein BluB @ 5,6-dimethylbenzimidazole synthase, flavin destructase family [hydrothermal vent metagenome]|uniref:Cobalamin biosynthesis protein BluB @ 5,6-dimethylbenzimidazole synthase, flavin destructase family n=1 Tax=hydrothermal vent metagenome TaxID=652676 RepID=A0A3B0T9D8_9ZZZZ
MENKNASSHFSDDERNAVYRAIFERRDIRQEFISKEIPEEVLNRILTAAHHAGSVGFMQPWNFIVVKSSSIRQRVKDMFEKENEIASQNYTKDKQKLYKSLRLEGIMESELNLCITCDSHRGGEYVIGRNTIVETDIFSTCCAVQNLWLAARAEGVGVGWVSIVDNEILKKILEIPKNIKPIAYLCLGYVSNFPKKPLLEKIGWRKRLNLEKLIFKDVWNRKLKAENE